MSYTYLSADMATGEIIADLPFIGVTWGRQFGGGAFKGVLPQRPPTTTKNRLLNDLHADATDSKRRAIYVLRDEAALAVYWITARKWNLVTQAWEVAAVELPRYLNERAFGAAGSDVARSALFSHTGTPIVVAVEILESYNDSFLLDLEGVTVPNTGVQVTYEGRLIDGKFVGEVIADLAKGEGSVGFDWRIDLVRSGPATFVRRLVMAEVLGGDIGLIAKFTRPHGFGNLDTGTISYDETRANLVVALGQGDGSARASAEARSDVWAPRTTRFVTFADESDPAVLAARAAAELRAVENPEIWELALRAENLDVQIGTFNPGDVGAVVIEPGADARFPDGVNLRRRVVGYEVSVPDEHGSETVKFDLDEPVGSFS